MKLVVLKLIPNSSSTSRRRKINVSYRYSYKLTAACNPLLPSITTQMLSLDPKPAFQESQEKLRYFLLVLGLPMDKTQNDFLHSHRGSQRDHQSVFCETLPIQDHRHNIVRQQLSLIQFPQPLGIRFD